MRDATPKYSSDLSRYFEISIKLAPPYDVSQISLSCGFQQCRMYPDILRLGNAIHVSMYVNAVFQDQRHFTRYLIGVNVGITLVAPS